MSAINHVRVALWSRKGNDLAAIEAGLARAGCQVLPVDSFDDLERMLNNHEAEVIVAPCQNARVVLQWLHSLPSARGSSFQIPVLTLASSLDVDLYLEAMQLGAFDCAGLPLERRELARLILRAAEAKRVLAHA